MLLTRNVELLSEVLELEVEELEVLLLLVLDEVAVEWLVLRK